MVCKQVSRRLNIRPVVIPFVLLFLYCGYASGQGQMLRGRVVNEATQRPLNRAIIIISGAQAINTLTDSLGNYGVLLQPGKYSIHVRQENYRDQVRNNVMVLQGKQQVQDFEMKELSVNLDSVIVKAGDSDKDVNLDLWNIQRFAAVFYDPARVVNSHAGVVNTDDQANSVSVRGTSPAYVQWKTEGVEIVNPNHLENAGTINDRLSLNGGGVSLFSAQLLQNSSFRFAPFDPSAGNALSGIFDMKLRNGNEIKREHTIQASLLGIDLCTEGPLSSSGRSSYLINYRYSTVGLLSQLGVNFGDEKINYQDLSYHVVFGHSKGSVKLFGIMGTSSNVFAGKKDSTLVEVQKDLLNISYTSATIIQGINATTILSPTSFLKSVFAYSAKEINRNSESSSVLWRQSSESDRNKLQKISTLNYWSKQLNQGFVFKAGTYFNYFINDVYSSVDSVVYLKGRIEDPLLQPFVSIQGLIFKKLDMQAGVHGFYQNRLRHFSLQPRLMLKYIISGNQDLAFHFGVSSQLQPSVFYVNNPDELLPTTAQSFSLIYRLRIKNLQFKNEFYRQEYFNVPVSTQTGFSAFNYLNELVAAPLESGGRARVYGYDISAERDYRNFYLIGSVSLYNSSYKINGSYKNARFNTNYNAALTAGKEFRLKNENKLISIDLRSVLRNGFGQAADSAYISYTSQLPAYFRTDFRMSYRKNRKNSSVIWAIDIQNVTAQKNIAYNYYDRFTKNTETRYQLGLIPVLSYKVLF